MKVTKKTVSRFTAAALLFAAAAILTVELLLRSSAGVVALFLLLGAAWFCAAMAEWADRELVRRERRRR